MNDTYSFYNELKDRVKRNDTEQEGRSVLVVRIGC